MKTFQQFCEQAYQLNEIDLKSAVRTRASVLLNPKVLAKGAVTGALKEPLKKATGNNPILNKAIDVGADWIAPAVRWGPAARAVAPAIPAIVAGAAINKNIITPAAMKTGRFRDEADFHRYLFSYHPSGMNHLPPAGTYPPGGEVKPQRPNVPILNTSRPSGLLNRPRGARNATGQYD